MTRIEHAEAGARIQRNGWTLFPGPALAELPSRVGLELVERALKIAAGGAGGERLRRSRHASTYRMRLGSPLSGETEFFVKLLDAPRGLKAIRRLLLGSRAARMRAILDALVGAQIAIAPVLLLGDERAGDRRTLMVTARVEGEPLPRLLRALAAAPALRRERLDALGAEVGRLHRAGFIHGDLTPYNIFVTAGPPARFSLIDHERTTRPRLNWERRRLRNLVQLCRFDIEGMGPADRLRIVDAYATAMGAPAHRLGRRVTGMLRARRLRDSVGRANEAAAPARSSCRPGR